MKFKHPKGNKPTQVWIGEERYDSWMEGTHQKIFDCMGIRAKHHPWVPAEYCEPDYVTEKWDGGKRLYIESKDLYFHKNLPNSLRFGRENQECVYYMGEVKPPKDLTDLVGQVIAKGYGPSDRGFNPFSLYSNGLKDIKCCVIMVTKAGYAHLVPIAEDCIDDMNGFTQSLIEANIDIDKTLGAYRFGAAFTDWDAIQRPEDDRPITKKERQTMIMQEANKPTEKRVRKTVNEQQSFLGAPVPLANNGDRKATEKDIIKHFSAVGLNYGQVHGNKYLFNAYNRIDGDGKKFETIIGCFFPLKPGEGYKSFHHLIVEAITDCVCKHWDVIRKDPEWFRQRLNNEINNRRDQLLKELKDNRDHLDVVIADKYNKYASKHGAETIDISDEDQTLEKQPAESKQTSPSADKGWKADVIEAIERISRENNAPPEVMAKHVKNLIDCIHYI